MLIHARCKLNVRDTCSVQFRRVELSLIVSIYSAAWRGVARRGAAWRGAAQVNEEFNVGIIKR